MEKETFPVKIVSNILQPKSLLSSLRNQVHGNTNVQWYLHNPTTIQGEKEIQLLGWEMRNGLRKFSPGEVDIYMKEKDIGKAKKVATNHKLEAVTWLTYMWGCGLIGAGRELESGGVGCGRSVWGGGGGGGGTRTKYL